ncbi:putative protein ATP11AUN [Plecturocebus cupreus]
MQRLLPRVSASERDTCLGFLPEDRPGRSGGRPRDEPCDKPLIGARAASWDQPQGRLTHKGHRSASGRQQQGGAGRAPGCGCSLKTAWYLSGGVSYQEPATGLSHQENTSSVRPTEGTEQQGKGLPDQAVHGAACQPPYADSAIQLGSLCSQTLTTPTGPPSLQLGTPQSPLPSEPWPL